MIHRQLKSFIAQRGITQVDIARQVSEKLGKTVSRQMVNHVFKGRIKSRPLRETICQVLDIDPGNIWA